MEILIPVLVAVFVGFVAYRYGRKSGAAVKWSAEEAAAEAEMEAVVKKAVDQALEEARAEGLIAEAVTGASTDPVDSGSETGTRTERYAPQPGADTEEHEKWDSGDIMFTTLQNLGCQPHRTVDEDDPDQEQIVVDFQGERFVMDIKGPWIIIRDYGWDHIRVDSDTFWRLIWDINLANWQQGPSIVTSRPNEDGVVWLHSRFDIMLNPGIPDKEEFVRATLKSFFGAKTRLKNIARQQLAEEQEQVRNPDSSSMN